MPRHYSAKPSENRIDRVHSWHQGPNPASEWTLIPGSSLPMIGPAGRVSVAPFLQGG